MIEVDVGRVVLSGLDLPPERAARVRALLVAELERAFEKGPLPAEGASRVRAEPLDLPASMSDAALARSIALRVAAAAHGGGRHG